MKPDPQALDSVLRALRDFPVHRDVTCACGRAIRESPLSVYATCPACGKSTKLRNFAGSTELEDIVDAVIAWSCRPGAAAHVEARKRDIMEETQFGRPSV